MDTYEVYLKLDKQISFENKIFPYHAISTWIIAVMYVYSNVAEKTSPEKLSLVQS